MPASRLRARASHLLARARRTPRKVARVARRTRDRVRPHQGPALSVVMPVYNVGDLVRPALESVLGQSFTDLEVIVVDDGSLDHSMSIVEEIAARDPRVRIVTKKNAGLGAARNTGTEHATGQFLCFVDSDDLVRPRAYETMVGRLRASGSDFVTGPFDRGDETETLRPMWVRRTMGADRTGITIRQEPDLLLDITAWNKVFRRSFWDRYSFAFIEGVRYEDQVPITRAYLTARSFDVVREPVYVWRTRLDGSSITQQKTSAADLTDRLRSQQGCAELIRSAPEPVRHSWYRKLLDYDLPNYVQAALYADDAYVGLLVERLERLREEVPAEIWHVVAFRNRATSWVLSHGHPELAARLREWFEQAPAGLRTRTLPDGRTEFVPPFEVSEDDLPSWIRQVHEVDVRPLARLTGTRWEGDELVLRGSAYLPPLTSAAGEHHLRLELVDDHHRVEVPVTRFADPLLDVLAEMSFADMSATGFEARIDAAALAASAARGQRTYSLEFHHTQGEVRRTGGITTVHNVGSGGTREPREVGGRMVRLAGVVEHGLHVQVRDTFAWTAGHRPLEDGSVELEVKVPPGLRVLGIDQDGPGGGALEVRAHESAPDRVVVRVAPAAAGTAPSRLRARFTNGRSCSVLWGEEPNVVGTDAGGFLRRSASQGTIVAAPAPAVSIDGVEPVGGALRLTGTSLGAEGHRVVLRGTRATAHPSEPLGPGRFDLLLPLVQDPWGTGDTPLPPDTYEAVLVPPGTEARDCPEDPEAIGVRAATTLREPMPLRVAAAGHWAEVGMTHLWNLRVEITALDPVEGSERRQQELREQAYAAFREEDLLDAVLLESFSGKSAGDSPAALARELVARGGALDVAMSVVDHSVSVPEGVRAVVRESEEWFRLVGRARYLVNNANFPFWFRKRPDQVYLQTWHGTPLKKIANDIADQQYFSITYRGTMQREAQYWDQLVSPSPYCSEILPRAFGYAGPLLEAGYPRNDALVAPDRDEVRAAVRARLGLAETDRVVLYAPTWRESARSSTGYGKVLFLRPQEVVAQVPDAVVLVRGHANTALSGVVQGGPRVVDVTLYPDINDLFLAADVLVTDYSSVMFDFSVLDRPMLFLVPDLADYGGRLRGFYVDFEEVAPGPLCATQDELVAHLRDGTADSDEHRAARARFREQFAPWDDGAASARVADVVFGPAGH